MNAETIAVVSPLALRSAETDLLTSVLAQDFYDAQALVARYQKLSGSSPATAKKRLNLARRFAALLAVSLRLRQQVLYPAAEAADVPRGLLMDARSYLGHGFELVEAEWDETTLGVKQKEDSLFVRWLHFESMFRYEADYFIPACRTAGLTGTNVFLQLAIRKRDLVEEQAEAAHA